MTKPYTATIWANEVLDRSAKVLIVEEK
jgi:hypothetical protein